MTIFFAGPLPPPVHGFSEINKRMLSALRSKHDVVVFDLTPRANAVRLLVIIGRFLWLATRDRPKGLYLAFSGGVRQWIDLLFVIIAQIFRIPIFIHHHSFSYLCGGRFSVVLRLLPRKVVHIVLCGRMGESLVQRYAVERMKLRIISNVAFIEDIESTHCAKTNASALQIGFLSNITAEKGIGEFFDIIQGAKSRGLKLSGLIAGPVDESVKKLFLSRLQGAPNVKYLGAVYDTEKANFFNSIDVLIFPTRYHNEAEPVTILEAMGHGIPVVAFARGCIEGMIPPEAGVVFRYSDAFVVQSIDALRSLCEGQFALAEARRSARSAFVDSRSRNQVALNDLVVEIGGVANSTCS